MATAREALDNAEFAQHEDTKSLLTLPLCFIET